MTLCLPPVKLQRVFTHQPISDAFCYRLLWTILGATSSLLCSSRAGKRQRNVSFRIVDDKPQPELYIKASNLRPRTQEVFAALGVLDRILNACLRYKQMTIHAYGKLTGSQTTITQHSPYGEVLQTGQNRIERILSEELRKNESE